MELKEKIAQMIMLDLTFWNDENGRKNGVESLNEEVRNAIKKYKFGGVVLFGACLGNTKKAFKYICDMQEAAISKDATNQISLLMAVDQEGGKMVRIKKGVSMPGNLALGAIKDRKVTKEVASCLSQEIASLGFNVNFAPVVDVNNNPNNPVIGTRSFSSDAKKVSKYAKAYIEGVHSQNIGCCLKHFPGHGDTFVDSHTGLPTIDKTYEELEELELIPYKDNLKDAEMVMTAHILYPKIEDEKQVISSESEYVTPPATLSKTIIGILRNQLEYQGVVITDALTMRAIKDHFSTKEAAKLAINAGVDMLLMPLRIVCEDDIKKLGAYIDGIYEMVLTGEIPESRINESFERIINLKRKLGLVPQDEKDKDFFKELKKKICYSEKRLKEMEKTVGSKEHKKLETTVTNQSITLVKNNGALPLNYKSEDERVVFFASDSSELTEINNAIISLAKKYGDDFKATCQVISNKNTELNAMKVFIGFATKIVVTYNCSSQEELDPASEKGRWGDFIDSLISEAHKNGKEVIVVSSWLPYNVARFKKASAIVCCYGDKNNKANFDGKNQFASPNLSCAIRKLFSSKEYTGKLPMTVFELDKDYKYTTVELYPIGYGLKR